MSAIDGAEHRARIDLVQSAAAERDQLVQQAQGIAHAALGRSRHQRHRRRIELQMLSLGDELQAFTDEGGRQPFEAELQTARKNGNGQLLRIGGCQQEFDMRRRLFQRLEQGIEGVIGEHVDFVDQVHLKRPRVGAYCTLSSSSRVSSTLVREAASTSMRSTKRPSSISRHAAQMPQGFELTPAVSQFSDLAKMRAIVVFPTPRVPVNRNAWCTLPLSRALPRARTTCSCPTISANRLGRHLRASTM